MRRILFHESSLNGKVGGSHHSLLLLVKQLNQAKYEKVVVFNSDMALRSEFEKHCKVIIWKGLSAAHFAGLGSREGWNGKFRSLPGLMGNAANTFYRSSRMFYNDILLGTKVICDYALLLKREKSDLFHQNNSFDPYWNVAARLCGVPAVQHIRGVSGTTTYAPFCHLSAKVICISESVKTRILELGIDPKKVVRIYNAVDCRTFRPTRDPQDVRAELGVGPSEHLVSLFGNIQQWKGQITLAEASVHLRKKYKGIRCVLFGEIIEQDYAEEIKRLIHAKGLEDVVLFAGYKSDVANWMNASDVIVHASIKPEPFGRVLIEAMTIGKPVIGAGIGAVPEIVENRVSGLLFQPGDHGQLCDQIDFLLSHPDEAERLGKNAACRIRKLFDVQQQISAIESLYEDIFNRR
jgi:glycosyltransferase involved in cell wall biosynthesis